MDGRICLCVCMYTWLDNMMRYNTTQQYIAVRSLTKSLKGTHVFWRLVCDAKKKRETGRLVGIAATPWVSSSSISSILPVPIPFHRPHPLPGGPPGRGQDVPGALHRHGARPALPAAQPRGRARCVVCWRVCWVRGSWVGFVGLVGWLVGWLVGGLVGWLVGWLVNWLVCWRVCMRVGIEHLYIETDGSRGH